MIRLPDSMYTCMHSYNRADGLTKNQILPWPCAGINNDAPVGTIMQSVKDISCNSTIWVIWVSATLDSREYRKTTESDPSAWSFY